MLFLHVLVDADQPIHVVLVVASRPMPRGAAAQVVLPSDPHQAGVDLTIDLQRDLSFPAKSYIGSGAYGQVGVGHCSTMSHKYAASCFPQAIAKVLVLGSSRLQCNLCICQRGCLSVKQCRFASTFCNDVVGQASVVLLLQLQHELCDLHELGAL